MSANPYAPPVTTEGGPQDADGRPATPGARRVPLILAYVNMIVGPVLLGLLLLLLYLGRLESAVDGGEMFTAVGVLTAAAALPTLSMAVVGVGLRHRRRWTRIAAAAWLACTIVCAAGAVLWAQLRGEEDMVWACLVLGAMGVIHGGVMTALVSVPHIRASLDA